MEFFWENKCEDGYELYRRIRESELKVIKKERLLELLEYENIIERIMELYKKSGFWIRRMFWMIIFSIKYYLEKIYCIRWESSWKKLNEMQELLRRNRHNIIENFEIEKNEEKTLIKRKDYKCVMVSRIQNFNELDIWDYCDLIENQIVRIKKGDKIYEIKLLDFLENFITI